MRVDICVTNSFKYFKTCATWELVALQGPELLSLTSSEILFQYLDPVAGSNTGAAQEGVVCMSWYPGLEYRNENLLNLKAEDGLRGRGEVWLGGWAGKKGRWIRAGQGRALRAR